MAPAPGRRGGDIFGARIRSSTSFAPPRPEGCSQLKKTNNDINLNFNRTTKGCYNLKYAEFYACFQKNKAAFFVVFFIFGLVFFYFTLFIFTLHSIVDCVCSHVQQKQLVITLLSKTS